ncbi:MAG TPA: hypothetical protein VF590_08155 [Isosphaeraceae bacterium]
MLGLNDSPTAAVLLAGLAGARPLGRPTLTTETAAVLDEDDHLALKLKVLGLLLADLDGGLVGAQVRQAAGPRFGDWSPQFFQAIAAGLVPEGWLASRPSSPGVRWLARTTPARRRRC